jgi:hypothetical protein
MHPCDFIRRNVSVKLEQLQFHPEIVTLCASHAVSLYNHRSNLPLGRVYQFVEGRAIDKAKRLSKHNRYTGKSTFAKKH